MARTPSLILIATLAVACGGGGSGGGGGGGPPPPAFATVVTTPLAISNGFARAARLGTRVAIAVSEAESSADLNGDGDQNDSILHVIDTATDATTNLGFAVTGPILASDRQFAFLVHERDHNQGSLNGDADTGDAVWHTYDPGLPLAVSNPFNTSVANPTTSLPAAGTPGGFLLLDSEAAQGADLNGDGDMNDAIPVTVDNLFVLGPLPFLPHAAGTPIVARSGRIVFAVSEPAGNVDHNGDGDALDNVLYVVSYRLGAPLFTPVGGGLPRAVANNPFTLTDDVVAYLIDEASDYNLDRNGDGDMTDAVLAVSDVAVGGEFLPMNGAISTAGIACDPQVGIAAAAERIVVGIDERAQGQTDFNGDVDFFDVVVGWVDTRLDQTTLHAITGFTLTRAPQRADGTLALLSINERSMAFTNGVDLNGDGDDSDDVAFRLDMAGAPGTMRNLNFAVATLRLNGSDALLGIPEAGNGNGDINGNGVVGDVVQFYLDLGDAVPPVLGLGLVANAVTFFRMSPTEVRIAALVPEDSRLMAYEDLNGDGDSSDNGVLLLAIDPSQTPLVRRAPNPPFFAGTGSFFVDPPMRLGDDAFAFPTSEAMAGKDLNGDGDAVDTVLGYVRVNPPPP